MPIFVNVVNPLKPLADFKPEQRRGGFTVAEFIAESGIDMTGKIVIVEGKKTPAENWCQGLGAATKVIITPEIGSSAVIIIVLLIVIAVALFFFMPGPPITDGGKEADTAYTLRGQKNQKRLGEAIEKHYGRMRIWPSYMASPYVQFKGNDQYFHGLFCVGLGKYLIHNIKIENTQIGNFDSVEHEIYTPQQRVKLFPTNVQTSSEVGGIELFGSNEEDYPNDGGWSGPFVASSPGANSYKLQLDFSCRQGLFVASSDGSIKTATVQAIFQRRKIDSNGKPLGGWVDLIDEDETTLTINETRDDIEPMRFTRSFPLDDARYEIRGRRTNEKSDSIKLKGTLHWEAMRTFNETEQNFGNVTLLAVEARATNNLNDSSKSAFNLEVTSILPVYNLETETWTDAATRNPVWAFCDVVRANYGKHVSKSFLDMESLCALALELDNENIYFDGTFDTGGTVWAALQAIMSVAKAVPIVRGGVIGAIRDKPNIIPTLGFNGNNIVRDSMVVTTRVVNHSEHDGLEIEYLDPTDWKRKTVNCLVGTDAGIKTKQVKLLGCTSRNRAYRWGMYQRAVEVYQTDNISFETGLEGATASFGDLIAVKHETLLSENDFVETHSDRLAENAMQYETLGGDSVTVIALPFLPDFEPGETYRIALRDNTGLIRGPYSCTLHPSNPTKVVLEVALEESDFEVPANAENTLFWFGLSGQEYALARITKIEPGSSDDKIKITAIPYDARIYSFESLEAPDLADQFQLPELPALPEVAGVRVDPFPNSTKEVVVSWKPALGATSYLIKKSNDGVKFRFVARVLQSGFVMSVEPGTLWVRVQGINQGAGPFDQWTGTVGAATSPPATPENLRLANPFDDTLSLTWDAEPIATSYAVRVSIGATLLFKKTLTAELVTFSKAYLQSKATAAGATMGRDFVATVQAVNSLGSSPVSAGVTFSNPLPSIPGALAVGTPSGTNYPVTWEHDQEDDFSTYKLYASLTPGFTPGGGNLVASPAARTGTLAAPTRPLYWKVSALDFWGLEESVSAQGVIP